MGRAAVVAACLLFVFPAGASAELRWRGIVEGPYGRPWDHAARERIVRWMPSHGFNAYVHAPKDDLFQRTRWRDAYPAAQQAEFDAEIRLARSLGVEWIPNLSPAVPLIPTPAVPDAPPSRDLCFSCPEDLDAVLAKLEPFRAAGSRTFMISFDDVSKAMTHPQDAAAYGVGDEAFGRANGDFLTRLWQALRERTPDAALLTVGADYSGTADTAYLRGLRTTLRPEVEVMWTGTGVPSQDWPAEAARAYGEAIGRTPLVWDNWTNNDTAGNATPAGTVRIFLGPYARRAEAAGAVGGFFFNPGNEADLNMLPLATAGDWMRDPAGFDGRASWLRAVREIALPTRRRRADWRARRLLRETLRAWAETSYSTKLDPREAPTFGRRTRVMLREYDRGGSWPPVVSALDRELALVTGARRALAGLRFAAEAGPFLDSAQTAATGGRLAAELLAAERPSLEARRARRGFTGRAAPPDAEHASSLRERYGAAKQEFERNFRFTYGWRGGVGFEIPPYAVPRNLMDEWFDAVDARDQAWQERADAAAASVRVSVGGRPVALGRDGSFRLSRRSCGRLLEAVDGAGGATAIRLPRCR